MPPVLKPSLKAFLSTVEPFSKLPAAELDRLGSIAMEKAFAKGETAFSEGEAADRVWILKEGRVQIFKYSSTGRPFAIENIGPGEFFGTLCRLGAAGRSYPCTAVAATASRAVSLPESVFLNIYNRFPVVVMGVCALCSQRLNAIQALSCAGQEPVEKRIAAILVEMQKRYGDSLPVTKREIAERAGTTVETTIRTISGFAKKGWVVSTRGRLTLKKPAAIQELL